MRRLLTRSSLCGILMLMPIFAGAEEAPRDFDEGLFRHEKYANLLCFDLRIDRDPPSTAVIASVLPSEAPQWQTVLVPVAATDVGRRRDLLATWASYPPFTLINYAVGPGSVGTYTVSITPSLQPTPEASSADDDLPPGLYFIRDRLSRKLILVRPDVHREFGERLPGPASPIDTIAVALPHLDTDPKLEKRPRIAPVPSIVRGAVHYVEFSKAPTGRLVVRYSVDETAGQHLVKSYGLKGIAAILVPFITLLFLDPSDIKRPVLRKIAVAVLLALQLGITVAVVFVWQRVGGTGFGETVADFAITLTGIAAEIMILVAKRSR